MDLYRSLNKDFRRPTDASRALRVGFEVYVITMLHVTAYALPHSPVEPITGRIMKYADLDTTSHIIVITVLHQ
jgi:hypothetical protein